MRIFLAVALICTAISYCSGKVERPAATVRLTPSLWDHLIGNRPSTASGGVLNPLGLGSGGLANLIGIGGGSGSGNNDGGGSYDDDDDDYGHGGHGGNNGHGNRRPSRRPTKVNYYPIYIDVPAQPQLPIYAPYHPHSYPPPHALPPPPPPPPPAPHYPSYPSHPGYPTYPELPGGYPSYPEYAGGHGGESSHGGELYHDDGHDHHYYS